MTMRKNEAGELRLTLAGKLLLFLVGLGVLAFAAWTYRDRLPLPQSGGEMATTTAAPPESPAAAPTPAAPTTPPPAGVLARVRESGVLRVGMEPDAPPLHFINDRKQEDGFDFRLAGVIAEGIGAKRVQV